MKEARWLLNAMHHATRHGSDGTFQFFGIPSATSGAAIKQGWGCDLGAGCQESDFNSTGFVNGNRFTVAIMARGPLSSYGSQISHELTAIARRLLPYGLFPLPAPSVATLSVHRGSLSGGSVVIHGSNFRSVWAVYVGTARARSVHVAGTTWLRATPPARASAGTVAVRVMTSSGLSSVHPAADFRYIGRPTVASVSPPTGPTAGGASVTIHGTDFIDVTGVTFAAAGTKGAHALSPTTLRVTTPPHDAGTVTVVVRTRYGTSAATVPYEFVAPPTITSLSPTSGSTAGGDLVTLSGANYREVTGVRFGSTAATSVSMLPSGQVQVQAPANPAGTVDVRISTAYGTSPITAQDRYTYLAQPQITPGAPADGQVGTGYSVRLHTADGRPGTWTVSTGALPTGLTLSGASISGTPTAAGTSRFSITFNDRHGLTTTEALTLDVVSKSA